MHAGPQTIVELLDEGIDQFRTAHDGRDPTRIYLGRRQVAALRTFGDRYAAPFKEPGAPNYNGIPITGTDDDNLLRLE